MDMYTDGSAITELRRSLEEYLSLLIGLTKKGIRNFRYTVIIIVTLRVKPRSVCVLINRKILEFCLYYRLWSRELGGIQVEKS